LSRFKEKKQQKKHVQHNHGQKLRIALLMNCVKAAMFLGSADPTMDKVLVYTRAGRARYGSVCFEATSFFSFWRKSLIETYFTLKRKHRFFSAPIYETFPNSF